MYTITKKKAPRALFDIELTRDGYTITTNNNPQDTPSSMMHKVAVWIQKIMNI